jgi:hypothetical protein
MNENRDSMKVSNKNSLIFSVSSVPSVVAEKEKKKIYHHRDHRVHRGKRRGRNE